MQSAAVMTTKIVTVELDTDVRDIAKLLLKHSIRAVPVVDAEAKAALIAAENTAGVRKVENHLGVGAPWMWSE